LETDRSTNVGADLEFAQGRGNLTIDVYNRIAGATKGHGILFDPRLPATAGFADPSVQNVAKMQNKGFDFALAYSGTIGAGKVWSVSVNAGHYKNKILEIAENLTQFFGPTGTRIGTAVINQIGQPIGAFYGLQANGYFPDSADAASHDDALGPCAVPPCQTNAKVGRIRFVDQITVDTNGDGRPDIRDGLITSADRTIIGSPHPDLTAGLDLGFRTGSWDFSATVFGSFGGQIFDAQKDFYVFRDFSTNVVRTGSRIPSACRRTTAVRTRTPERQVPAARSVRRIEPGDQQLLRRVRHVRPAPHGPGRLAGAGVIAPLDPVGAHLSPGGEPVHHHGI